MTLREYERLFERWRDSVRSLAQAKRLLERRRVSPSLVEARARTEAMHRKHVSDAHEAWLTGGRQP